MFKRINFKGETIVEVLIAVSVAGATIAAAYVSSSHSIAMIKVAKEREDAVGVAKTQIELIGASNNRQNGLAPSGLPFCMHLDTNNNPVPISTTDPSKICSPYDSSNYYEKFNVIITQSPPGEPNYIINVSWTSFTGNRSSVEMYYVRNQ